MTTKFSNCHQRRCVHFAGRIGPPGDCEFVCTAYPFGIPDAITRGDDLHNEIRGDETQPVIYSGPEQKEPR